MKKTILSLLAIAAVAFAFTACSDVPEPEGYSTDPNAHQGGGSGGGETAGDGTEANPFNIAAAIAKCKEVGSTESTEKYYIKGYAAETHVMTSSEEGYGNVTFDLVDEVGSSNVFKAFQVKGTNGASLPKGFTVNQGDEVVVYGAVYNYSGKTPETVGKGAAYIVSVNGKSTDGSTSGGEGDGGDTPAPSGNHGTAEAPLTVAQAMAVIDAESTASDCYVKGIISKVDSYNATYKSITYWISDDGGTTTQLQVYSGKGLNGADFAAKEDLNVGAVVVVKGNLKKYNTTYEFDKSNVIVSITNNDGGGSTGGDPQPPTPSANHGTAEAPITVAQAIAVIDAETTASDCYVKGTICQVDSYNSTYGSITYWISDDGGTTTKLEVYGGLNVNGSKFTAKEDLTTGKVVVVKGNLKKYGEIYEFDKNNVIVSIQ